MNDDQHDDWDKLFEQLPLDVSVRDEHRERLRARALEVFESPPTPRRQPVTLQAIGRTLMKYKAPHWTAAALLLASMFWIFQSSSTPAFALDELVENLMKARTARYDVVVTVDGQPPQKMKAFYREPAHFRQEFINGYINIADWNAGKMVGLDPGTKQATVMTLVKVPEIAKGGMQANQFHAMRDALRQAISDPDTKVESLGEKQFDGRKTIGFRFQVPLQPMTVWADPETKFPVRIESTMNGPPKTEVVMMNYEFDIELDKSLFSIEIPEGYKVMEMDVDASPPTEADFITSLRMCCESSKGGFPAGVDLVAISKYAAVYLQQMDIDKDKGPTGAQMKEVLRMMRGFNFVILLPAESDAHYAGADVKQGDAERAVFWYKPAGAEKYRVVYADLQVKESDAAPDVEGAGRVRQ